MTNLSRARTAHREYQIEVAYTGCRTIGYLITRPDGREGWSGYSDERISPRRFARQLAAWLDRELEAIGAIEMRVL
jgi:hypothetical protein